MTVSGYYVSWKSLWRAAHPYFAAGKTCEKTELSGRQGAALPRTLFPSPEDNKI